MASLRTLPHSKNFIACFTDANGRRKQRSTGTHIRKDAAKIAEQYESAATKLKTEAQIRKVISDLYEEIGGAPLASGSIRRYLTGWVDGKKLESSDATATKYNDVVTAFLDHLGVRADLELSYLNSGDMLGFRDGLAKRLSVGTVNVSMKIMRTALNAAHRAGLIDRNPAVQVSMLKTKAGASGGRRAFTLDELRRILAVADEEWRGLVTFGVYTGQRLGDLALLTWANLDLDQQVVSFVARKTDRQVVLPMVGPIQAHLLTLRGPRGPRDPVFPAAHKVVSKTGKVGTLSNRFHSLLVSVGLAPARSHDPTGKGRTGKRAQSEISFHALRHTATSLLKNAGVSDVVAREFIGHESAAVSKHYTHIDTSTLRAAAEKMPDLSKP